MLKEEIAHINPFPLADTVIPAHLQQNLTCENIVAKGEIAYDEQFPLLQQLLIMFSTLFKLSFMGVFHVLVNIFFKVVCCRFIVCEKGLNK